MENVRCKVARAFGYVTLALLVVKTNTLQAVDLHNLSQFPVTKLTRFYLLQEYQLLNYLLYESSDILLQKDYE